MTLLGLEPSFCWSLRDPKVEFLIISAALPRRGGASGANLFFPVLSWLVCQPSFFLQHQGVSISLRLRCYGNETENRLNTLGGKSQQMREVLSSRHFPFPLRGRTSQLTGPRLGLGWPGYSENSQVVTGTETQGTALGQQSDPQESWDERGSGKVPTAKSWVEVGKVGGSSPTFIQNWSHIHTKQCRQCLHSLYTVFKAPCKVFNILWPNFQFWEYILGK